MKKLILAALMACACAAVMAKDLYASHASRLCETVAETAGLVSDMRKNGDSWERAKTQVDFDAYSNTDIVIFDVLRDAYDQALRRDITETIAYSSCRSQLLRVR